MWLALGMLPMVYREGEGQGLPVPFLPRSGLLEPFARGVRKTLCNVSYSFPVGPAQCESQSLNILKTSQQLRALPAPLE